MILGTFAIGAGAACPAQLSVIFTPLVPRGGFLKIVSVGISTYASVKTSFSRADISVETGFRADIGRNADWNYL